MDAYHFTKGATALFHEVARTRMENEELRFTTPLVGPWDSITILYDIDVETAHVLIAELDSPSTSEVDAADRPSSSMTLTSALHGAQRVRKSEHEKYEAYVLLKTKIPRDRDLFDELEKLEGYAGSALLRNKIDILLLMGGATPEVLETRLDAFLSNLGSRGRVDVCYQPPLPAQEGQ